MLSDFMSEVFNKCDNDKCKLGELICEYIQDEPYKSWGSEFFKIFEDAYSEDLQLKILEKFKANYLAKNLK